MLRHTYKIHAESESKHANINIISQKLEHMWQESLCVVPFEI